MAKFFGKLFERRAQIEVDLGKHTLQDIMSLCNSKHAELGDYYIRKILDHNHIITKSLENKEYATIHNYQYFPEEQIIKIKSRMINPYLTLIRVIALIVPILIGGIELLTLEYALSILGLSAFLLSINIFSVISNSGEAKRELIIRINYMRRHRLV